MTNTIKEELGGMPYCAPLVSVLNVEAEGLLCQSLIDRPDNKYEDNIMPEI